MSDLTDMLRLAAMHCVDVNNQAIREIEKLRGEVAALKAQVNAEWEAAAAFKAERDALKAAAEKGTEYVLAQINQDLRAEVAGLEREVVNRNRRALDGDKATAALNANIDLYEQIKAERDAALAVLKRIAELSCEKWARDTAEVGVEIELLKARGEK